MNSRNIRTAQSSAADVRLAVAEFHSGVAQPDMELVIFFCSSEYDLDLLVAEMERQFAGIQVAGCTTAGEIGPGGYLQHSLSGASFSSGCCVAVSGLLEDLQQFHISAGHDLAQRLLQQLEKKAPQAGADDSFALLLIDGMSIREEPVAHALQYALGKIRLFGGSAGDDRKFDHTHVYCNGRFHSNSAVLVLVNTVLPFRMFMTQHFVSTDERLVVTDADTDKRIVREINGLPAAQEYARLAGVEVHELDSKRFAASPMVVVVDGADYVRSIQKANPDGSLTFFCAIEEGVVLRMAHGADLVNNLKQAFGRITAEIGKPQLVIGCDCTLRNQEIMQDGIKDSVSEVLRRNNAIGFSSYGEQFRGIHVNQTFTGIAIGESREVQSEPRDA